MISGKNIAYITLLAIAGVLIYCFFFRKKTGEKTVSVSTPEPEKKPGRHVGENLTAGMIVSIKPETKPEGSTTPASSATNEAAYVGPQDCAENCNLPYHNRILFCYNRGSGSPDCLAKAEKLKQECLGKCSESIPRYKDLEEVATPLQEDNYNKLFNNLFDQGYV